jgi:hypothetical protein
MSYFKGFGTGSNSNGQFWFGGNTFPGFLFKKNSGAGNRKNPSYGLICNRPTQLWNKYTPGAGVGGSSTSARRAKMRLATSCNKNQQCGKFYPYLGLFDNYTGNPNGYYPYLTPSELIQYKNNPPRLNIPPEYTYRHNFR